jgi:hypothetical protein
MPEVDDDKMSPLTQEFHLPPLPRLPNFTPIATVNLAECFSTTTDNESAFSSNHPYEQPSDYVHETDAVQQSSRGYLSLNSNVAKAQFFSGKIKFKNEGVRATTAMTYLPTSLLTASSTPLHTEAPKNMRLYGTCHLSLFLLMRAP